MDIEAVAGIAAIIRSYPGHADTGTIADAVAAYLTGGIPADASMIAAIIDRDRAVGSDRLAERIYIGLHRAGMLV